MALRYTAEFLLFLRDSPLCIKPDGLPPLEDWMGTALEQARTQSKTPSDRLRSTEIPLLDQTNRRPGIERHVSRNSANPEDIIFGPPRMAFSSATARGTKTGENERSIKEADGQGRFNLRNRSTDLDNDRLREGRTTNPLRRRVDGDQDNEGWSMVKPRKSFGSENAEKFHGKMGGNFRDEKKPQREKEDREPTRDRTTRGFDTFTRDKDVVDAETRPRNGLNRGKLEPWHKTESSEALVPEKKERDRTRSWRDREKEVEATEDRGNARPVERRWGREREQRVEREPEWFDEPAEDRREAHTQQDFQKWMEQMKKSKGTPSAATGAASSATPPVAVEPPKPTAVQSPPVVEAGPDKFFMAFGGSSTSVDATTHGVPNETASKPKAAGKSSRFTSFFSQPQDDPRGRADPPMPVSAPPMNGPIPTGGPAQMLMQAAAQAPEEDRQAFQQLLAKLHKQTNPGSATPPGPALFSAPQTGSQPDMGRKSAITSPEPFQQYGGDRRETPMGRPPSQQAQEILAPRPQPQSARPDQLLQDLVGHHQRVSSQGSGRPDQGPQNNQNAQFLMNLMMRPDQQQQKPQQPQQHHLQHMMGLSQNPQQQQPQQHQQYQHQSQPQKQQQMPQTNDAEHEYQMRENQGAQRKTRQQQRPPGFPMMDSPFQGGDHDVHQNQPTHILQRPPPHPGMDQMPPNWMSGGQMPPPPPQARGPMMAPPGLVGGPGGPGGPGRNLPMPHVFPPNFPPGGIPPDAMPGMPPRNMPPPPPGFYNGPPHGFMPPGLGGFNGPPGPDSHAFGGSPFERGMPPGGNGGRGANYGRP